MTPILNALARAYLEFYTQNAREPDYFAMSAKMLSAMREEAGFMTWHPAPIYGNGARFQGRPVIEMPLVEGTVMACGDPMRIRMPFVIDSTTQGQEAR